MKLYLLRKTCAQALYTYRLSSLILEKRTLNEAKPSSDGMSNNLTMPENWWMFTELPIKSWPFWARVLICFWLPLSFLKILIVVMTLIVEKVSLVDPWNFQIISSLIGDIGFSLGIILLNDLYSSLHKLCRKINETKNKNQMKPFVPLDIENKKKYFEFYIPVVMKTNELALNLAYNKRYQAGCAIVSAMVIFILDPTKRVNPYSPGPTFNYFWGPSWFTYYEPWFWLICWAYLWSIVGMIAWTIFIVLSVTMSIGWNYVIEVHAHKPIRDYYKELSIIVSKSSRILVILAILVFPTIFIFQILPPYWLPQVSPPENVRTSAWNFSKWALIAAVTIIALSFFLPYVWIHHGMKASKEMALIDIETKLLEIKSAMLSGKPDYYEIYKLLAEEFRSLRTDITWPLDWRTVAQIASSFILPILSLLLSSGIIRLFL